MAPIDINNQEINSITLNGSTEIDTVTVNGQEVFSATPEPIVFRRNQDVYSNGDAQNVNIGSGYSGRNIVLIALNYVDNTFANVDGNPMNQVAGGNTGDGVYALYAFQDDGNLGSSVDFNTDARAYQVFTMESFTVTDEVETTGGSVTLNGASGDFTAQFYAHQGADDDGGESIVGSNDLPGWDSGSIFSKDVGSGEIMALAYNIPDNGNVSVPSNPSNGRWNTAAAFTITYQ